MKQRQGKQWGSKVLFSTGIQIPVLLSMHSEQENLRHERETRWAEIAREVDELADKLGHPIDAGIRDAVIGLLAHELPTNQSCEGHDDRGEALPWVSIESSEPEGWEDNKQLKEEWRNANKQLATKVRALLEGWYEHRQADQDVIPDDQKLILEPQGIFGAFRIQPAAQERMTKLSQSERAQQALVYREEMRKFSTFLQEHFLTGA